MKKTLTLSIVIPAYNEENHLVACLQAIARQSTLPNEVIVVDNNSTDNTPQIAQSFPFVRLLKEKQQGLYFSRQKGMNAAGGDILGRIDADTILDPHWVETVKAAFSNPRVMAASGPVGYHDMPLPLWTKKGEDMFLRLARSAHYAFLMGANMAVRRSAWKLISDELCSESFLFEDIDIAIHLNNHGLTPSYVPSMSGLVSSRRFEDKPFNFLKYIHGHSRTLNYHHQDIPAGARLAETVFALVYLGFKPLHMLYDPKLRRPSIAYLARHKQSRPDPMTSG